MSAVLVADDDIEIANFVATTLELEGYDVMVAHDGEEAIAMLNNRLPELALVDVMMPGKDGLEVCRAVRSDPSTAGLPIILLTARDRATDKVRGFEAGADDYILKPFDTLELLARVRATLRRNSEMRAASPLTGLPGNQRITDEIATRAASGRDFAVCHLDLDNFKEFNDRYSWVRGDEVISLVATALRAAAIELPPPQPFIGHIGGDDFVAICLPSQVDRFCRRCLEIFDERVKALHDPIDAERGYMVVVDRRGVERQVPLTALSIGVASTTRRQFTDPRAIVAVATEMKNVAKSSAGSSVAVDRRTGPIDAEPDGDGDADDDDGELAAAADLARADGRHPQPAD